MNKKENLEQIIKLAEELDLLQQNYLKNKIHERFSMLEEICEEAETLLEEINANELKNNKIKPKIK